MWSILDPSCSCSSDLLLISKCCEWSVTSDWSTSTKSASPSLKKTQNPSLTHHITSLAFIYLYTWVACTVMSPLVAVQKMSAWLRSAESSAKSAEVKERERQRRNGQTKVETTNCRGFGSLCPRWMRRKKLEKRRHVEEREVCSLERDSREAWAPLLCFSFL